MLDVQNVEIAAPADLQAEETDAWDLAAVWAEFAEQLKAAVDEIHENLWKLGNAGDWAWKREPWVPPDRPEKLRGIKRYGPARVVTEPPGGMLWLKCARRFKKGSRSDHT